MFTSAAKPDQPLTNEDLSTTQLGMPGYWVHLDLILDLKIDLSKILHLNLSGQALRVCRQIHHEAAAMLYEQNAFDTRSDGFTFMYHQFRGRNAENTRHVRMCFPEIGLDSGPLVCVEQQRFSKCGLTSRGDLLQSDCL